MSKLQTMKKQVTRQAAMAAGGVVAAFVLSMVTGYFADSAIANKTQVQNQFNQAQSQLGMMRGQINRSDDAEKRYVDIRLDRDNDDFLNDTDKLKNLLKEMKDQYRFSDSMRLTISTEKVADKPELLALNYKVFVREDMEMSAAAISDLHVYSFVEDMKRRMPGIIRIKNFKLNRKSSMSLENLAQLSSGNKVEMVDATIKFTWLTLEDRNPPKVETPAEGTPADGNAPTLTPGPDAAPAGGMMP